MNTWRILCGDVREKLAQLPAGAARCCVTSPPYWGLRDYAHSGQLGLESTPDAYVAAMVDVFREVRRVLADDGTVWLNLGDSYLGGGGFAPDEPCNQKRADGDAEAWGKFNPASMDRMAAKQSAKPKRLLGLKAKDLVGIPWMVAFALRADGWYLRSGIIWSKPNPMPESVTDRPTKAHEYIFLLSKSKNYYYDADAIAEPVAPSQVGRVREDVIGGASHQERGQHSKGGVYKSGNKDRVYGTNLSSPHRASGVPWEAETRNKRSVWTVTTQPYPDAHFATFPEALIEPCVLAGSAHGDTVLDPFTGSGTTGAVAIRHQRNFIGTELNPAYIELARKRINAVAPMFAQEVA